MPRQSARALHVPPRVLLRRPARRPRTHPAAIPPQPGRRRHQDLRHSSSRRPRHHPHLPARRHSPIRNPSIPNPSPPPNTADPSVPSTPRLPGVQFGEFMKETAQHRRQVHHHPLDVPRRGRPRARHPQHVHRLPAVARARIPVHRLGHLPRTRLAQRPAALRLRPIRA